MKLKLWTIRNLFLVLVLFSVSPEISAQKGYPLITPFTFDETIENDNFDIIQDENFNILIANRKGILSFDSRKWDLIPLPYSPTVLAKSTFDGSIYAGCRNGFGILEQDVTGKYFYKLLSDTVFTGEITAISVDSSRQYFISRNRIYYMSEGSEGLNFWEFPYQDRITGSFVLGGDFYFMVFNKGLYKAVQDSFSLVLSDRFTNSVGFVFSTEINPKEILVGTSENEIYLFDGKNFQLQNIEDAEYVKTGIITDGIYLGNDNIAIATLMGGVVICDFKTGQTSSIVNYKTGLPDDEIYCLGTDANHGLWICHSFGVSRIDNHLSVTNLTWYPGLEGNLTNSAYFNSKLYIGTSEGLYSLNEKREYSEKTIYTKPVQIAKPAVTNTETKPLVTNQKESPAEPLTKLSKREQRKLKKTSSTDIPASEPQPQQEEGILDKIMSVFESSDNSRQRNESSAEYNTIKKKVYSLQSISHNFEKISGISGKCTEIITINNSLLVSTNNGLYELKNQKVKNLLPNQYINFMSAGPGDNILFAGSSKTMFILELRNDNWEVIRELDALGYAVYSACMPSDTELWLGSDNSAHKLIVDSDFYVDSDTKYPIITKFSDKVILKNINKSLHFFLASGIYQLKNNEILPLKTFDDFSSLPSYYFSNDNVVWYRSDGKWNFIADSTAALILPEEYLNIFKSVQDIYLGSGGNLWIIANNHEIFKVMKDAGRLDSDGFSVYFSGLKGKDNQLFPLISPKISYKKSSLRIEFSAPYYIAPDKTEFSFRIDGLNNEWSEWSNVSSIDYPLLPPGEYKIEAKARNIFGEESEVSSISIIIKPPFWRTTIFYILFLIFIFGVFTLVLRIREKSLINAKLILEQKVVERTAEIELQKNEISEQKKEITDSIYYARRIQSAVLPSPAMLSSVLAEHFVLFLPRDIVSGDFYWSTIKGEKIVILAADCTGHGVPGAFMSMLGVSFLNEIVSADKLENAGKVLDLLRNHVKDTLSQSGGSDQARDGMDIALCIIDQKKMQIQFAGAYNPLYMIRDAELTEIKGDKMPIGLYERNAHFTNNVFSIQKGDCFYIFSDGFIDQFGGEFQKKFLSRPFKNLLLKIHKQPMNKQKEMLLTSFENWKGKLQQVDDVLIIGFRI
ncbi:MAG: SpoIIE family protein phosphatase [Bacteroidales bacterium]|nr:SpoIIE family protein phosphatase [Bacteroidales bacterium]MCB9012911.1 SpoIIE family protein phosphatase [Bacteroidales bacterium]